MNEEQNTEALKKARTFSDNKDKIDGFYNGYVQATIELEKENAELKAVERMALYSKMSDQLAKAKELLKKAQGYTENLDDEADKLYDEIEQLLNEVEK